MEGIFIQITIANIQLLCVCSGNGQGPTVVQTSISFPARMAPESRVLMLAILTVKKKISKIVL